MKFGIILYKGLSVATRLSSIFNNLLQSKLSQIISNHAGNLEV